MKVICIEEYIGENSMSLTLGKIYDVIKKGPGLKFPDEIKVDPGAFFIINDDGVKSWYNRRIVIPIEEWREKQLETLFSY